MCKVLNRPDLDNVQEATKSVLHRAQVAQKAGIIAAENLNLRLKIAQHDTSGILVRNPMAIRDGLGQVGGNVTYI